MRGVVAAPLLVAAAALACAQPGMPPGGQPDRIPPRVLGTYPQPFDSLSDPDAKVVIRFDERISERLTGVSRLAEAVLVSPATSPVEVDRKRRSIEISLVRGWQPGLVYRVVIQPVFSDLFNNQRQEPVDLVFTTGAPISETAVAGFVADGLTLEPVAGARLEARHRPDSTAYVAETDTAGFFALRYLPAGEYTLRAWLDQDRDRAVDFFEAQDSTDVEVGVQDTTVVDLALVPRDSTPPELARAEPIDSTKIRLTFDDYFPPGPVRGTVSLSDTLGNPIGVDGSLLHGSRLDSLLAVERAVADSLQALAADSARAAQADSARLAAGDTLGGDTLAAEAPGADSLAEGRPRAGVGQPPGGPRRAAGGRQSAGPPRPSRDLILVLADPLPPGAYRVEVRGVVNIRGLTGGGSADLVMPVPEPEQAPPGESPPADSAGGGGGGGEGTGP